jgi:hypothetical protein
MKTSEQLPANSPVTLKTIPTEGIYAVLLPVQSFPLDPSHRTRCAEFLTWFRQAITTEWKLGCELFLQHDLLHTADAATRFAENAKHWQPRLGLGLWPDRPYPALWTRKEFSALEPGQKMRKVSYKAFRVAKTPSAQDNARQVMFGLGATLEIWLPVADLEFFHRTREFMLPLIQERAFRSYPFYIPLLEGKSLQPEGASVWLCGASVYLRESPEDGGILIASGQCLDDLFRKRGVRFDTDPKPEEVSR